jgi:hypothetical protein
MTRRTAVLGWVPGTTLLAHAAALGEGARERRRLSGAELSGLLFFVVDALAAGG